MLVITSSSIQDIAQSLGIQVAANKTISDGEIRDFLTSSITCDKAMQIVQEHPEMFAMLNNIDEENRLYIIDSILSSVRKLILQKTDIEYLPKHIREVTCSRYFGDTFHIFLRNMEIFDKEDEFYIMNMLDFIIQESTTLIDTLIAQSQYADNLHVMLTEPAHGICSL